jgi:SAM-dependent methyltransferase
MITFFKRREAIVFNQVHSQQINVARMSHLESLSLPLNNKTVLEVGAGIGELTSFFEQKHCKTISTEARGENILEFSLRHAEREIYYAELDIPRSCDFLGSFDIVFMYGTLYHLASPELAIKSLSDLCELFLLETCVHPIDNNKINYVSEPRDALDQSFHGLGCRPARDWVLRILNKYFSYAYITATQPNHPDFPCHWPSQNAGLSRSIFVASKTKFENPLLQSSLPAIQTRLED